MPKVTVVPIGVTIEVMAGETVFHTAVDLGYTWPTVCGGVGSCRTCVMTVIDGEDAFKEPDEWEEEGLEEVGLAAPGHIRLACQALVCGDATVRKSGVRPPAGS